MDCKFPKEAQRLYDDAAQFAESSLAGGRPDSGFDRAGWRLLGAFGVFRRAATREAQGGAGAIETVAILEGLGRGGADRGLLFAAGAHLFGCLIPLARYGTPAQIEAWEASLRDGAIVGALAVTEAAGGSSFENIATTAAAADGGYRLSGEKTLITNAPAAGLTILVARQFPDRGALGLTAFLVPAGSAGLSVSPLPSQRGLRGATIGEIAFDGCSIPAEAVLGAPGAGLRVFSTAMCWERSLLLAGALGAAERELSLCVAAMRARGGKDSLLSRQAVTHRLARMKVRLEAARGLLYRAASALDDGAEDQSAAAMAKLAVSETLVANAEDGMRLMAGAAWRGAAPDFGAALDDAFGALFASGTPEMQLEVVARALQTRPGGPRRS